MVDIAFEGADVIFTLRGLHKLWALKGSIRVTRAQIVSVRADPTAARGWWLGIRMPGTMIPNVIVAGSFYQRGRRLFYDVRRFDHTIVVELQNAKYDALVIEVDDPGAAIAALTSMV